MKAQGAARNEIEGVARIALAKKLGARRDCDRFKLRRELGQGHALESREQLDVSPAAPRIRRFSSPLPCLAAAGIATGTGILRIEWAAPPR